MLSEFCPDWERMAWQDLQETNQRKLDIHQKRWVVPQQSSIKSKLKEKVWRWRERPELIPGDWLSLRSSLHKGKWLGPQLKWGREVQQIFVSLLRGSLKSRRIREAGWGVHSSSGRGKREVMKSLSWKTFYKDPCASVVWWLETVCDIRSWETQRPLKDVSGVWPAKRLDLGCSI